MSKFERHTIPFVDTDSKAKECIRQINHSYQTHKVRPLVFVSFADAIYKEKIQNSNAVVLDLFEPFIPTMERLLKADSSHASGQSHGITEEGGYMYRIDAINFLMKYDDGVRMEGHKEADLVLVGVSRGGEDPYQLIHGTAFKDSKQPTTPLLTMILKKDHCPKRFSAKNKKYLDWLLIPCNYTKFVKHGAPPANMRSSHNAKVRYVRCRTF